MVGVLKKINYSNMKFTVTSKYDQKTHNMKYANKDLKLAPTKHYEFLVHIVKCFAEYLAERIHIDFDYLWENFQPTVHAKCNKAFLSKNATKWMINHLRSKKDNLKPHLVQEKAVNEFLRWGIPMDIDMVKAEITVKNYAQQKADYLEGKRKQYEVYKPHVSKLIHWFGSKDIGEFQEAVEKVLENVECSSRHRGEYLSFQRIQDPKFMATLLMKIRLMLCLMTVTGIRGVAFWRHKLGDFAPITGTDGEYMLVYGTAKGGSKRKHGVEAEPSPVLKNYARVVHNVDATIDCIAAYYQYIEMLPEDQREFPFHFGVDRMTKRKYVQPDGTSVAREKKQHDYYEALRRQSWCLITIAAYCVMDTESFEVHMDSTRRIHAWRSYCATFLEENGATDVESNDLLGWSGQGTRKQSYVTPYTIACNNNACYFSAGLLVEIGPREYKRYQVPGCWGFLDQVDGNTVGTKIATLSVYAKVAPRNFYHFVKYTIKPGLVAAIQKSMSVTNQKEHTKEDYERQIRMLQVETQTLLAAGPEVVVQKGNPVETLRELFKMHFTEREIPMGAKEFVAYCRKVVGTYFQPVLNGHQIKSKNTGLGVGLDMTKTIDRYIHSVCLFGILKDIEEVSRIKQQNEKKKWWICYKENKAFRDAVILASGVTPRSAITSWAALLPHYNTTSAV